jgi:hypothetical protein
MSPGELSSGLVISEKNGQIYTPQLFEYEALHIAFFGRAEHEPLHARFWRE